MRFDSANLQGTGVAGKRAGGRRLKVQEAGEQGTGGGRF